MENTKLIDYLRKQGTEGLKELAIAQNESRGGYNALQCTLEVLRERMDKAAFKLWISGTGISH